MDIGKYTFSNRIVDKWNSLFECFVNAASVSCFKKYVSSELEPEIVYLCIWCKPVHTDAIDVTSDVDVFAEFGEYCPFAVIVFLVASDWIDGYMCQLCSSEVGLCKHDARLSCVVKLMMHDEIFHFDIFKKLWQTYFKTLARC